MEGVTPVGRKIFQSTLPAWGETLFPAQVVRQIPISIHSPRMGRDKMGPLVRGGRQISIHSPRMGRD